MVAPLIPLIAAGVGALGGIISTLIQNGSHAEARRLLEEARKRYQGVDVPELDDLEEMVADAETPSRSAFESLAPERGDLAQAQDASIASMGELSRQGMTEAERAMMSRALGEIQRRNAADRAALVRSQGGVGSGQALAMGQSAQQARAQQESDVAVQGAFAAQQRAMSALRDRYSMASGRSKDIYGRQANEAQAQDALAQANARFRLDKARTLGDMRQQGYTNQYNKTAGMAGQGSTLANLELSRGQGLGGAVAGGASALGRGLYSWLDEEEK